MSHSFTDTSEAADGPLFMLEGGRWSALPLQGCDPVEVPFLRVQELAVAPDRPSRSVGNLESVLAVNEPLMLLVDGGLGVVAPGSSRLEPLSAEDLELLNALGSPLSVRGAATSIGQRPSAVLGRARRLQRTGALRLLPEGSVPYVERIIEVDNIEELTAPRDADSEAMRPLDPSRVPVISPYLPTHGPPLSIGMLLSMARAWNGGALNDTYEFRSAVTHDEARVLLDGWHGPVVLLCSNYVWSYDSNIALASELVADNPAALVMHGGPHTPKYVEDELAFFEQPGVHLSVRGEGEYVLSEILEVLAGAPSILELDQLSGLDGITFRSPGTGEVVRTPDRDRIDDLDLLPSPYLSGEFDDLHPATWIPALGVVAPHETNRGCPYKCSFCDWGALTMSRIRKFSQDRVNAEMRWLAARGVESWMLIDANFGILKRDVEIAGTVAQIRRETGFPLVWSVLTTKNGNKHLDQIFSLLSDEGINMLCSISLQTRDEEVLEAIDRSNIKVSRYDDLASTFRRKRLPLICDFMLGLPGSTVESFKADLQWSIDAELTQRVWYTQVLPNAPMNAPEYRDRYDLEIGDRGVVLSSSTFTREDRERMSALKLGVRVFEHLGVLRHVLRYLQWDRGISAIDVIDRVVEVSTDRPNQYPLLSFMARYSDLVLTPPVSWGLFYDEVERFLADEFDVLDDPLLRTVLKVQVAVMPDRDRTYPAAVELDHDYVAYYHDATRDLLTGGSSTGAINALSEYPPGVLEVHGDPADLVRTFGRFSIERPHEVMAGPFWFLVHWELDSPLTRWVPEVRSTPGYTIDDRLSQADEAAIAAELDVVDGEAGPVTVPVQIGRSRRSDGIGRTA